MGLNGVVRKDSGNEEQQKGERQRRKWIGQMNLQLYSEISKQGKNLCH